MPTSDILDSQIRTLVAELIESAPQAPVLPELAAHRAEPVLVGQSSARSTGVRHRVNTRTRRRALVYVIVVAIVGTGAGLGVSSLASRSSVAGPVWSYLNAPSFTAQQVPYVIPPTGVSLTLGGGGAPVEILRPVPRGTVPHVSKGQAIVAARSVDANPELIVGNVVLTLYTDVGTIPPPNQSLTPPPGGAPLRRPQEIRDRLAWIVTLRMPGSPILTFPVQPQCVTHPNPVVPCAQTPNPGIDNVVIDAITGKSLSDFEIW
jgi:hypothetical protein